MGGIHQNMGGNMGNMGNMGIMGNMGGVGTLHSAKFKHQMSSYSHYQVNSEINKTNKHDRSSWKLSNFLYLGTAAAKHKVIVNLK